MFAITINEKGGETRRQVFDKPEITIGRVQGNDIILPKGNVSKRHSRIVFKDGKFIIVDLKSTNGTYVNGRKITSPLVIKGTDKVYIGDFILSVEDSTQGIEATPDLPVGAPPLPPPQRSTFPPPPPGRKTEGGAPGELAQGDDLGVGEGPPELPALDKGIPSPSPFDDEGAPAPPPGESDAVPEDGLAWRGLPFPSPCHPVPRCVHLSPVPRPRCVAPRSWGNLLSCAAIHRVLCSTSLQHVPHLNPWRAQARRPMASEPVRGPRQHPTPSGHSPLRGTSHRSDTKPRHALAARQSGSGLIPLPPTSLRFHRPSAAPRNRRIATPTRDGSARSPLFEPWPTGSPCESI